MTSRFVLSVQVAALSLGLALGSAAFAQGMKDDAMKKPVDTMAKPDSMAKPEMKKDSMGKTDTMAKPMTKPDTMSKDSMKK